jgi:coenzyme F420-0:L-glutamate ligase/coenzyme F420-1:gamma-L-glutamate ligase
MTAAVQMIPLSPFPLVQPGDDLAALISDRLADLGPAPGDVLVVAQKVVSKAEGRYVRLAEVEPGAEAIALAEQADKDPRLAQLILDESVEVLRVRPGVIIVEHRCGWVHANAGIDRSNIPSDDSDPSVLLLPEDTDRSARELAERLVERFGLQLPVIINDSAGRAWRQGTVGFALGSSGIEPLSNQVGDPDLYGRPLETTEVAVVDELAAAASLVMGQAAEASPVVLLRGTRWSPSSAGSGTLLRDRALDMFR